VIALDEPGFLQRTHPSQTWRCCNLRPPRKFDVGDAAIFLEFEEYAKINRVELMMLHFLSRGVKSGGTLDLGPPTTQ